MAAADPIDLAIDTYYWKPMAALARALELRAYGEVGLHLANPVLDLGCGDGRVAFMLTELGVTETPLCGFDISPQALRQAQRVSAHAMLVRADANALPFANGSFASAVSNGVLCSIPGGADLALREAHRVLRAGGLFVATVPTEHFIDVLLWPTVLERLSPALRDEYVRRLNQRLPHITALSRDEWQRRFAAHGLRVRRCEEFFGRRTGRLWSVLALQIFRTFGLLRPLGKGAPATTVKALWRRLLASAVEDDLKAKEPFGYLLLVARKDER